ncbi:unnamed protein product [Owenia fusiformis]|uniref:Uncharacterized protein n=1 Tax=Owenia fusiformis TaxID=6347 RepID=A0A8J1UYC5_OWEFU|nr:unnamed protein product [Owenia fusiformis]
MYYSILLLDQRGIQTLKEDYNMRDGSVVIRARFGKPAHVVFCVFACLTNLVVMISLLLAGSSVMTSLVQDLSLELTCMILAAVLGSYTLIGGLGATFYVSYFNTTLIFCMVILLVIEVYYNPSGRENNPLGNVDIIYQYLNQTVGPEGNKENSYLTFLSSGGAMFGVINIIGNFGTVFCDQSYWQSSVAAKPVQGVWGFIAGGLTWFAIPFTLATTMGLSYLALGTLRGGPLLSPVDVDKGLVPPVVAQVLLGSSGEYVLLMLNLMAVMSTGSAEVIAVASIIVYDIYQIYVLPFRKNCDMKSCVLCNLPLPVVMDDCEETLKENGNGNGNGHAEKYVCDCPPVISCEQCTKDNLKIKEVTEINVTEQYTCSIHGKYRQYQDKLLSIKNWIILWLTLATIPLILFCVGVGLNLGWVFWFTGVLIGCTVVPIALSVTWSRLTSKGMISGVVTGCACGLIAWLAMASTYPGGLGDFLKNTGQELAMFVGNCVSIGVGGGVCIIVSLITNNRKTHDARTEWEKTRNIENPLYPWSLKYAHEFTTISRPSQEKMTQIFKRAKYIAIGFGLVLTAAIIIIWPSIMISIGVLNVTQFRMWTQLSQVWAFIAAIFIITVPLIQEIYGIVHRVKKNRNNERSRETEQNGGTQLNGHAHNVDDTKRDTDSMI